MPFESLSAGIKYKSDYKYQLAESYSIKLPIIPDELISNDFIQLETDGWLTIWKGYAWDGPSGPVMDTKETMRASLIHDALYQLMRLEELDAVRDRKDADRVFSKICVEDGVSSYRAKVYYRGLRMFGEPSASPIKKKVVHTAP